MTTLDDLMEELYGVISPIITIYERFYGIDIDINLNVEIKDNTPS